MDIYRDLQIIKTMRVVLISKDYPPLRGGVSDHTYHLANALSEQGREVHVLTSMDHGIAAGTKGRVTVHPVIKKWGAGCIPTILRTIDGISPERVVLQYVANMYSYYAMPFYIVLLTVLLRLKGCSQTTVFHEVAYRMNISKPKYWGVSLMQRLIAHLILLVSNNAVTSVELYRSMFTAMKKRIHMIPVGSNILPVKMVTTDSIKITQMIAPHGETILATFGADAPQRKNDSLLKAVSKYNRQCNGPGLKILFIGGMQEECRNELIKLSKELDIEEALYFTGYLESSEVYKYLALSDIFYIFDVWGKEGKGGASSKSGALTAAYAAGLPVLSCKGDLTDDLFRHRENIFFVDKVSANSVLKGVKEILHDRMLRQKLRRNSQKYFESKLAWPVIAGRFIDVMEGTEAPGQPIEELTCEVVEKGACH